MIKVLSTPGPVPLGRSQSRARRVLSQVKQTLDPAATEPVEGSENGDRVLLLARWDADTCSLVRRRRPIHLDTAAFIVGAPPRRCSTRPFPTGSLLRR